MPPRDTTPSPTHSPAESVAVTRRTVAWSANQTLTSSIRDGSISTDMVKEYNPSASPPSLAEEQRLWSAGYQRIAGVDEAGRGPLAGPIVAAAVILPPFSSFAWLAELRDSKLLPAAKRERLAAQIRKDALAVAVGIIPPMLIDRIGIAPATQHAMVQAISRLPLAPDYLLIDAFRLPHLPLPQKGIIHGDAQVASIAAASILAKVERDRLMLLYDRLYPGYNLAQNKGYGTQAHREALDRLGPCPIHRRSFAPLNRALAPVSDSAGPLRSD